MTLRGIRTLGARMRVHEESSREILMALQQQDLEGYDLPPKPS